MKWAEIREFVKEVGDGVPQTNVSTVGDPHWVDLNGEMALSQDRRDYRRKPEPKYRAWKPEEVPLGAWVRKKGTTSASLLTSVSEYGACFSVRPDSGPYSVLQSFGFTDILESREHSVDGGKTWCPCGVAVEGV